MENRKNRFFFTLIIFFLTLSLCNCGPFRQIKPINEEWSGIGKKDDKIIPVKPEEDAIHPIDNKNYVEHWYFDARLDNGYVVVGFLWASEMLSHKPGVELHIYKPSGEKVSEIKSYDKKDFKASTEKCDVWVGKNHAYAVYPEDGGLPVYYLSIAEGELSANLTFHSMVPAWKPGGGKTHYGDQGYFAWVAAVPRARVEGSIRIGEKTIQANGIGYHDHNWETADLRRVITHWYWGRVYTEEFTLLYAYVKTNKGYGGVASTPLMLAYKDKIVFSTGEMVLTEGKSIFNEKADRTYPEDITIKVKDDLSLTLKVKDVIDAHNLLEGKNRVLKWAVNTFFGHPGWFRFHSDFNLHVKIDGITYDRTGETLHEMVALK